MEMEDQLTVETPGHPVLDSIISRYRAGLGTNIRRDRQHLQVLHLWELTAAQTSTEDESISHLNSLYSLAIDHYRENKPSPAPSWNLLARYRHWLLLRGLRAQLSAAHHADKYHFYMVKTYPQVVAAYHRQPRNERQS